MCLFRSPRTKLARKIFSRRIFSRKMLRSLPEFFEPLFCGSEKFPQNSHQISQRLFPSPKSKKITNELLQERRENISFDIRRCETFAFRTFLRWPAMRLRAMGCTGRTLQTDVFLPSKHLLSASLLRTLLRTLSLLKPLTGAF